MKFICQCLFTFTLVVAVLISVNAQTLSTGSNTISVTGESEIRVVPDEVILTLGVETADLQLRVARTMNDERIKKTIGIAKTAGVKPEHIQTDYISIQPEYENYRVTSKLLGYVVRKTMVIRLKDVSKFESLLADVLEAGVTHVQGIEFRTTELRKHRDQARALAIKAAQEKAAALAKEAGRQLGKALSVGEGYSGWYSGYSSWWGNRYGQMTQNVVQIAGGSGGGGSSPGEDSSLSLGQISVRASVSMTFALE